MPSPDDLWRDNAWSRVYERKYRSSRRDRNLGKASDEPICNCFYGIPRSRRRCARGKPSSRARVRTLRAEGFLPLPLFRPNKDFQARRCPKTKSTESPKPRAALKIVRDKAKKATPQLSPAARLSGSKHRR